MEMQYNDEHRADEFQRVQGMVPCVNRCGQIINFYANIVEIYGPAFTKNVNDENNRP